MNLAFFADKGGYRVEVFEWKKRKVVSSRFPGAKSVESVISTNLGILRARMGHGRKALELFQFALSIERESGDKEGIVSNLVNIAALRHLLGESSGARIAMNDARAELSQSFANLQDFQFEMDHNHAISRIYEKPYRWVLSELVKIEKGYDFEKRDQGPHRLASLLVNKGEALSAQERFEEAQAAYERALQIMKKTSRVYSIWPSGGNWSLRIVGETYKQAREFPGNFYGFDGELYWRAYRGMAAACIDDDEIWTKPRSTIESPWKPSNIFASTSKTWRTGPPICPTKDGFTTRPSTTFAQSVSKPAGEKCSNSLGTFSK